jgi:hypothetical protein
VNVWNLDGVKLCECSNLLTVFHNFAYEVSKVAFVIAPVETSRSKQIRRGWCHGGAGLILVKN